MPGIPTGFKLINLLTPTHQITGTERSPPLLLFPISSALPPSSACQHPVTNEPKTSFVTQYTQTESHWRAFSCVNAAERRNAGAAPSFSCRSPFARFSRPIRSLSQKPRNKTNNKKQTNEKKAKGEERGSVSRSPVRRSRAGNIKPRHCFGCLFETNFPYRMLVHRSQKTEASKQPGDAGKRSQNH